MFPPLCYTNNGTVLINDTENSLLKKTLPPEAYKTIKGTVKNTAEDTEKKTSAASDELTTYEVPESENTDAQSNVSLIADDGLISDNVEVNVRFKIVEVFQESGQKIERAWQNCKRLFFR